MASSRLALGQLRVTPNPGPANMSVGTRPPSAIRMIVFHLGGEPTIHRSMLYVDASNVGLVGAPGFDQDQRRELTTPTLDYDAAARPIANCAGAFRHTGGATTPSCCARSPDDRRLTGPIRISWIAECQDFPTWHEQPWVFISEVQFEAAGRPRIVDLDDDADRLCGLFGFVAYRRKLKLTPSRLRRPGTRAFGSGIEFC